MWQMNQAGSRLQRWKMPEHAGSRIEKADDG